MQQIAERPAPDDLLQHLVLDAVDGDAVEAEDRLAVAARHALEQFGAGGDVLAERRRRQRVQRIAEDEMRGVGDGARRDERRMGHFVELVGVAAQHVRLPQAGLEPALKCQP